MFDTRTELTKKIDLGEDSTIELKRALPHRDDLADEISAFANAIGGVILIGVDDDSTIVGLDRQELELMVFCITDKVTAASNPKTLETS